MPSHRNIKLTLEYDGTHFFGFQKQKNQRTIQGELESGLKKLFQKKIKVIGAGRTDSGVHAASQVVNFHVHSQIPLAKIQQGLNHYLPEDLAVVHIKEVSSSFHSQYSAKWKRYEYCVLNSRSRSPLHRFRAFYFPHRLRLAEMKRAARLLSGTHNFRAFESSGSRRKSAVRLIRQFNVRKKGNLITFTIESNGFLYKMVRSMIGTLLEVGLGRIKPSDLRKILRRGSRSEAGPTVPSSGLILKGIIY